MPSWKSASPISAPGAEVSPAPATAPRQGPSLFGSIDGNRLLSVILRNFYGLFPANPIVTENSTVTDL